MNIRIWVLIFFLWATPVLAFEVITSSAELLKNPIISFRMPLQFTQASHPLATDSTYQATEQLRQQVKNAIQKESGITTLSNASHVAQIRYFYLEHTIPYGDAITIARKINEELGVSLEPIPLIQPMAELPISTNDPYRSCQVHISTKLEEAWKITQGSSTIKTAILDTGYLPHEDIDSKRIDIQGTTDFVTSFRMAGDGDGVDSDPTDVGDAEECGDLSSWHGNHITGIFGATPNNNLGIVGVDWNATIVPIRVLGIGGGAAGDATNAVNSVSQRGDIRLINMSLGVPDNATTMCAAFANAVEKNILPVVAAGNSGADVGDIIPARCVEVVTVGSSTPNGYRNYYSNYGLKVDILASGGSSTYTYRRLLEGQGLPQGIGTHAVLSTVGSSAYWKYEGTSMATPQVTGVASLVLSVNSDLQAKELMHILQATATVFLDNIKKQEGVGCDTATCGAGILDPHKAVEHAQNLKSKQEKPILFIHPRHIYLSSSSSSRVQVQIHFKVTKALTGTEIFDVKYRCISPVNTPQTQSASIETGEITSDITITMPDNCTELEASIDYNPVYTTRSEDKQKVTVYALAQGTDRQAIPNETPKRYFLQNNRNKHSYTVTEGGFYWISTASDMDLELALYKDNHEKFYDSTNEDPDNKLEQDLYVAISTENSFVVEVFGRGETTGAYFLSVAKLPDSDELGTRANCLTPTETPVKSCATPELVSSSSSFQLHWLFILLFLALLTMVCRIILDKRE